MLSKKIPKSKFLIFPTPSLTDRWGPPVGRLPPPSLPPLLHLLVLPIASLSPRARSLLVRALPPLLLSRGPYMVTGRRTAATTSYARTADMDGRCRRCGELTSARTADGDEAAGGWWTEHGDEARTASSHGGRRPEILAA